MKYLPAFYFQYAMMIYIISETVNNAVTVHQLILITLSQSTGKITIYFKTEIFLLGGWGATLPYQP